jgi:hypothetical protein
MKHHFEITSAGFDASNSETDGQVLWVEASSESYIRSILVGVPFYEISKIADMVNVAAGSVDYTLPKDDDKLRLKLISLATDVNGHAKNAVEAKLVDLLSKLLGCKELNTEHLESQTSLTIKNAADFLTTHYNKR